MLGVHILVELLEFDKDVTLSYEMVITQSHFLFPSMVST